MTIYKSTNLKQRAIHYRRNGYSLKEISDILSIAKSTASIWVGKEKINAQAKKRIQMLVRTGQQKSAVSKRRKTREMEATMQSAAITVMQKINLSDGQLQKLILAILYGCEGAKTDRKARVTFMNSDPLLIKQFTKLMRRVYKTDDLKWRCCLHLHSYHNEKRQINYWSHLTNIPKEQFNKVYQKQNTQKRLRKNYQGCLSLRYYDSLIARELYYLYIAFLAL